MGKAELSSNIETETQKGEELTAALGEKQGVSFAKTTSLGGGQWTKALRLPRISGCFTSK